MTMQCVVSSGGSRTIEFESHSAPIRFDARLVLALGKLTLLLNEFVDQNVEHLIDVIFVEIFENFGLFRCGGTGGGGCGSSDRGGRSLGLDFGLDWGGHDEIELKGFEKSLRESEEDETR